MRRWIYRKRWLMVGLVICSSVGSITLLLAWIVTAIMWPHSHALVERSSVVAACTYTLAQRGDWHHVFVIRPSGPLFLVRPARWCSPTPLIDRVHLAEVAILCLFVLRLLTLKPLPALWRHLWFWVQGVGRLQPGTTHGQADWASLPTVWSLRARRGDPPFVLGRAKGRAVGLPARQQELHTLIVGVSGAGKSSALFVANLLRTARWQRWQRWQRHTRPSCVTSDPKGEFYQLTSKAMQRGGYHVARVDFFDPSGSRYNPLMHIHDEASATRFAEIVLDNTGGRSSEQYWDNCFIQMLVATIMHLNHLARQQGRQAATLREVADFCARADFRAMAQELQRSVPAARRAALQFMANVQKKPELEGSIQSGMPLRFQFLNDPRIAAATSANDIPFAELGRTSSKPWSVYVSLTRNKETVIQPLVVAFFTQLYDALVQEAEGQERGRLKRTVILNLDEAGTVGRFGDLARWLNTARSVGVWFRIAVQTFGQLVETYGEVEASIIAEGCQTFVFFGGAGVNPYNAEWMSKQLGQATRIAQARSASRDREDLLVGHGGLSRQEVGSPLMAPDDFLRLKRHWAVVVTRHMAPYKVHTKSWEGYRWMRRRAGMVPPAPVAAPPTSLAARRPHDWAEVGTPLRKRQMHVIDWRLEA